MDPSSASQGAMDPLPLTSSQKEGTLGKEGSQKAFLSLLSHKYQMQYFSKLSEWCQITITYSERITQKVYILQTFTNIFITIGSVFYPNHPQNFLCLLIS